MSTTAYCLPAELLSECLRAVDMPTRVHASHVSRTWRSVAVSDPRLWDNFQCSDFQSPLHQDTMLDKLQAMLLRSCSLPFRLRIPLRPVSGSPQAYYARVIAMKSLDVHRLAIYEGPLNIFIQLYQDMTPLPTLTSLGFYNPDSYTYLELDDQFSEHNFPSLQRLEAHCVSFPANNYRHRALRHLTCSVNSIDDYQRLFRCFPNLVEVQLIDLNGATPLPSVSFPRSVRSIALRPGDRKALDPRRLLRNWTGEQIPRLVLHQSHSLRGVLPLFLAAHAHRVELRLNSRDREVELTTLPTDGTAPRTWTMTPSRDIETFLGGLETRHCRRLTSISVAIEQLGRLFAAQLDTPGLKSVEFRLVGTQAEPRLPANDGAFFIRAPRLKRVAFTMDGSVSEIREHLDEMRSALDVLHSSFRALIVYNADLLDSITLSVPAGSVLDIACPDFSRFTERYTVRQRVQHSVLPL